MHETLAESYFLTTGFYLVSQIPLPALARSGDDLGFLGDNDESDEVYSELEFQEEEKLQSSRPVAAQSDGDNYSDEFIEEEIKGD